MEEMSAKERIILFLSENKGQWFTISEISRKVNISYPTTLKVIEELLDEGLIIEDRKNRSLRLITWKEN